MLPQYAFSFLLASPSNKVGDACFSCSGNLAFGTVSAPALFDCPAPSCYPVQNLYWPWKPASKIPCALGSDLPEVEPKSVLWSDLFDLLTCGRDLVSGLDGQQCPPTHDAESTKSAHAQPEKIYPDGVTINKNATEILQLASSSGKKSPYLTSNYLRVGDLCREQSQWLGTLSAIKNSSDLSVLGGARAKNSTSNRCPKPTEMTHEVTRDKLSLSPKNTKCGTGIGYLDDQSTPQIKAEQSFDLTSVERLIFHVGAPDEAFETKLHQNFCAEATPVNSHLGSTMLLSTRPVRCIPSSISPAKSHSFRLESVCCGERIAPGYAAHRPLGWPDHRAIFLSFGHPNEVPRAKLLANATTISAQTRPKAGCPTHHQQTQTPTRISP